MKETCYKKSSPGYGEVKKTVQFLNTVSEENRLRIICLLKDEEKCVCEINESLDLSQNLVSHHLQKLKEENLIELREEGTKHFYSLNEKRLKKYLKLLNKFLN
ncbi:MAG: metalloregulator ArsR/SmtB family transcription factor [Candidatus Paceibacterota bacterium]